MTRVVAVVPIPRLSCSVRVRSKMAELERGILGVLAHYKRFSTVPGGDVGQKAASTILLKMRDLDLCGQRDEEEPT